MNDLKYPSGCRRFDVFEAELAGPDDGNPFLQQWVQGIFTCSDESVVTQGFYDGDGIYRIRFMPSFAEKYTFILRASFLAAPVSGTFFVKENEVENHGPVHVDETFHFAYADGTRYLPVGTTCYVWDLQDDEQIARTLTSLEKAGFNKIRFCIFPKHYVYNYREPYSYPYEGTPVDSSLINDDNFMDYYTDYSGSHFDHTRFNPKHFQRVEYCLKELEKRQIEADLILFHPYDRWGFSHMSHEEDVLYLRYVINRFAAFHHVWWAMANEWDLLTSKTEADWEDLAAVLLKYDPYHHLRSIHNCRRIYNQNAPWITHVSMQRIDLYKGAELTDQYRLQYNKPVIMDELGYEGNLPDGWGNLTAEEMVRRAWETAVRGGYPGHSETYLDDLGSIWWSHGGELRGESWKRFAFLKKILEEVPGQALAPVQLEWDSIAAVPEQEAYNPVKSQYIFYYSFMRPSSRTFDLPAARYIVDVIDTWNMTVETAGTFQGKFRIELPRKMYMAVRLRLDGPLEEKTQTEPAEPEISEDIIDEGNGSEDEYAEISEVTSPAEAEGSIVFDGNDLDKTESIPTTVQEEPDEAAERTLNIPPVNFNRSINEPPKKK